jgi:hypothetical protein
LIADLIEPDVDDDVSFPHSIPCGILRAESVRDSVSAFGEYPGKRVLAQREWHVLARDHLPFISTTTAVGSWVDRSVNGSASPCSCCH